MEFIRNGLDFKITHADDIILENSNNTPMIYVGYGKENIEMHQGNFDIEDYIIERRPLNVTSIEELETEINIDFDGELSIKIIQSGDCFELKLTQKNPEINRFWFRVRSDSKERCYGCGEQMSYFNLKGRHYPLWSSEPGVGRDKSTYITWRADVESKSGGDYYNTNYPQPTFVSTKHYYLHVESTAYADFDFRDDEFHELQIWEVPTSIRIEAADTFIDLLEKKSDFFGRQPELPDWIYDGLVVGVQGGNERSFRLLDETIDQGIKVSAIWCQDWCGKRQTSFGKRLQWDWKFNKDMYPDLPLQIEKLHAKGIKFMGYINPYLVNDGDLYREGKKKGVFATKSDGSDYLVNFGEFYCGVVDLTNPEAYEWFKDEVIKKYSIDIGIDGWMADFGEYLPTDDMVLHNGVSPMIEHNHWPVLWAKCNYDALVETGRLGDILYFMRAGGAGTQKYCPLLWAGDQSVDFTIHDGLASVIVAALSSGMSGCGLSHSDIGGYTSLFGNTRTKELFLRWAEMAAFTPVMRTHEGNRPDENFQYYDDKDCMKKFARLVKVYTMLKPYIKSLVAENAEKGIPVQRPLFLHYEKDEKSYDLQYEYLLGSDVLVAPVYLPERVDWEVYLPDDNWIHLWSGEQYGAGIHTVNAPIGDTPVFYRRDSSYSTIFEEIRKNAGNQL